MLNVGSYKDYLVNKCKRITFEEAERIFRNGEGFVCCDRYTICSDGNGTNYFLSSRTFPKCLTKGIVTLENHKNGEWFLLTVKDIIILKGFAPAIDVKEVLHRVISHSRERIDFNELFEYIYESKIDYKDFINPIESPRIWAEYFGLKIMRTKRVPIKRQSNGNIDVKSVYNF